MSHSDRADRAVKMAIERVEKLAPEFVGTRKSGHVQPREELLIRAIVTAVLEVAEIDVVHQSAAQILGSVKLITDELKADRELYNERTK